MEGRGWRENRRGRGRGREMGKWRPQWHLLEEKAKIFKNCNRNNMFRLNIACKIFKCVMKFNSEKKTWNFSSKITKTMWGRKKLRQKWPLIRFPKKNVLSRYFICLYSNDRHNYGSGMPNILNWDFAKRWDHLFLYKPRTLRHPTFLCLDSIPTLRRTLKKASVTGKIELNPHEIIPPPPPSLCREELIYLHIYIKSNYVVIPSFYDVLSACISMA